MGVWGCGNKSWQKFKTMNGQPYLYYQSACFWANRCIDAYDGHKAATAQACGFDCWGGRNQGWFVEVSPWKVKWSGEALFWLKSRAQEGQTCMTYGGTEKRAYVTKCGNWREQLWFVPSVKLPGSRK
jgi:hypothetical protein